MLPLFLPTIYVLSKYVKNITIFHLKIINFTAVKKSQYIAWACFRNVVHFDGILPEIQTFSIHIYLNSFLAETHSNEHP